MSFLKELVKQKQKLKETETIITNVDGRRFIEGSQTNLPNTYGFIVDTKPDDVPALIVDYLYIGSQDCVVDKVLEAYNITYVLSLGINVTVTKAKHKYVVCLDLPETDLIPVLKESLPYIHGAIRKKENVLIHCNAGVSRTGIVAIAYLMQYMGMEYEDAFNLVKARRPAIQPNVGFRNQLKVLKCGEII